MSCSISTCFNESITCDGYCNKHKYFTTKDNQYIINHVKFYFSKLNTLYVKRDRAKLLINLFNYLKYKKEFLLSNGKFLNVVLNKAEELSNEIKEYVSNDDYKKFLNIFDNLKKL